MFPIWPSSHRSSGPPSSSSSTWICAWRPNGQTRENVRCVCTALQTTAAHIDLFLFAVHSWAKKKLFDPGRCSFLEGDGAGWTRERVCSGRREALERESFSQLRYYFRFSKLRIVMYKNAVEIGYRTIGGANNPAGGDLVRLLAAPHPPPVRLINQSTIQSTPDPSPSPAKKQWENELLFFVFL